MQNKAIHNEETNILLKLQKNVLHVYFSVSHVIEFATKSLTMQEDYKTEIQYFVPEFVFVEH